VRGSNADKGNILHHGFVSYVAHAMGWSKTGNAGLIFELGGFLKEKYGLTLPLTIQPKPKLNRKTSRVEKRVIHQ
jgi:hypothetical protein